MTETDRDYFPQPNVESTLVLLDARLLMRPPADAATMADYIAEACAERGGAA